MSLLNLQQKSNVENVKWKITNTIKTQKKESLPSSLTYTTCSMEESDGSEYTQTFSLLFCESGDFFRKTQEWYKI